MKIRVLYFATLRDLTGKRQESLELPEGSTVGHLRELLAKRGDRLAQTLATALIAINREFAFPEEEIHEGDEIAVFPPVSGGLAQGITITRLADEPIDTDALLSELVLPTTGAACVFSGFVRAVTERGEPHETALLEYEAYAPMAEEKLQQVAQEIRERWPSVEGLAIIQRLGELDPGSPTVLIACTAAHRDMGIFEAARYGIDRLKQIVPIWKKEIGPGGEAWVEGEYTPTPQDRQSQSP